MYYSMAELLWNKDTTPDSMFQNGVIAMKSVGRNLDKFSLMSLALAICVLADAAGGKCNPRGEGCLRLMSFLRGEVG